MGQHASLLLLPPPGGGAASTAHTLCGVGVGYVAGSAVAVSLHELAHVAAAWSLGLLPGGGAYAAGASAAGVLRWVSSNMLLQLPLYLLGLARLLPPAARSSPPHVTLSLPPRTSHAGGSAATDRKLALVRLAGPAVSALLLLLAAVATAAVCSGGGSGGATLLIKAVCGGALAACFATLLGAVASDVLGLEPPMSPSISTTSTSSTNPALPSTSAAACALLTLRLFCGNVGLLVAGAATSAVDVMSVLRTQVAISSQRGAQSGGLVTLIEPASAAAAREADQDGTTAAVGGVTGAGRGNVSGVRSRCAPGKRDHLSVMLSNRFGRALGRSPVMAGGHGIFAGHTRFATSSQPSEAESHPHQWSPPVSIPVWRTCRAKGGRLEQRPENFGVWITHNGDFDFWRLMGQDRTHNDVAAFLTAALGTPSPAKCDSVRVAGMIEMLRTQGLWLPSLRLAYYDTAVCSFEDVVASGQPDYAAKHAGTTGDREAAHQRVATRAELAALAAAVEAAFDSLAAAIEPLDVDAFLMPPLREEDEAAAEADAAAASTGMAAASAAAAGRYADPSHRSNRSNRGHRFSPDSTTHGGGAAHGGVGGSLRGVVGTGRPSVMSLLTSPHAGGGGGAGGGGLARVASSRVSSTFSLGGSQAGGGGDGGAEDEAAEDQAAASRLLLQRSASFGAVGATSAVLAQEASNAMAALRHGGHHPNHQQHGSHTAFSPGTTLRGAHNARALLHGGGGGPQPLASAGASGPAPPVFETRGSLELRRPQRTTGGGAGGHGLDHGGPLHGAGDSGLLRTSSAAAAWGAGTALPSRASGGASGGGGLPFGHQPVPPSNPGLPTVLVLTGEAAAAAPPEAASRAEGPTQTITIATKVSPFAVPQQQQPVAAAVAAAATPTGADEAGQTGAGAKSSTRPSNGAAAAAAPANTRHAEIVVSYGEEGVRIASALGWARDGARDQLVAALAEVARKHLEATPGWASWRATVPSLESLLCTALSYFAANDLYAASCRFLKNAKGSFGLAILCSLEPDRLCMGAWGQPMSMAFSQRHKAVVYGSETNCAMVPIATKKGAVLPPPQPQGGDKEAEEGSSKGGARDGAGGGAAAAAPLREGDEAIVTHLDEQLFPVHHVEERQADAITMRGVSVEIIRDPSRRGGTAHLDHSAHGGAGGSVRGGAGGSVRGGTGGSVRGGVGGSMRDGSRRRGGPLLMATGDVSVRDPSRRNRAVAPDVSVRTLSKIKEQQALKTAAAEAAKPTAATVASSPQPAPTAAPAPAAKENGVRPGGGGGAPEISPGEALVDNGWTPDFATHRIDIDEGDGEMMQLVLTDPRDLESATDTADGWALFRLDPFVRLRAYQIKFGQEVDSREEFEQQERIVQLVGNPYITFSRMDLTPGRDYVADDLSDIPHTLSRIRDSWTDPASLNRQSAEELFDHLDTLAEFALSNPSAADRPGVDLLLTGVEASLWLAEQWAGDLKLVFPQLNVLALSANKVISVLGNARGRIPPTGSTFCRSSANMIADHHTLCIAVSQSGQTFPTIHACRILNQLLPGRVYAMCGSVDTKMALALGQRMSLHSPFTRRVFNTCAGGRCAEPPSVVCAAIHQTMSELLSFLVVRMRMTSVCASGRPLGMILTRNDMVDLRSVRDRFIDTTAPQLTGYDHHRQRQPSEHHNRLVAQGRKWGLHVVETPMAWVLSLIHILATVVSGWPVIFAIVHGICLRAKASYAVDTALSKVALAADSVLYMFLPIVYAMLLRWLQRRPIWHRMGKRTIVVADVPYVHQIIETYVSKMYALAYGIASVEVHGANPLDHFVHRFTHRVVRGLLIALGRPDGRLYSQTKSESWVLLGLLQAKVITNWGHQPEVVSIGHNPYHPAVVDTHLQLPTNRPPLLIEALEHTTGAVDPNQLWAGRRHMVTGKFPLHEKARVLLQELEEAAAAGDGGRAKPTADATSNGTKSGGGAGGARGGRGGLSSKQDNGGGGKGLAAQSLSAVSTGPGGRMQRVLKGQCNAYTVLKSGTTVLDRPADELRPLLGAGSKHLVGGHLLYRIFQKTELSKMFDKLAVVRQLAGRLAGKVSSSVAREAVAAVGSTVEDVLNQQTVMEQLIESRYLSLERLIAFMVMFHAMARRTADWWPLTYDIARSQSGLRVATTAAPVTASELEQSLAEILGSDVVEERFRRDERAKRERLRHIMGAQLRKRAAGEQKPPAQASGLHD
ncbi:hypothetical protein HXX76_012887 [Chlamydomonas incerta]|uniref:Glutamine amidotransferase type-2 domain-containing protein n=1 Tax=Chlamydomonas incerta TaxID=51695 RepID=A0A835VV21_CHLIN|nr:hypothetical protein HXX76_012887 [Chlamydomonas incerta]|eukprot:KAG2426569.1 hypothetical protein HXX76_012887 [Chlamydomonas incerta]